MAIPKQYLQIREYFIAMQQMEQITAVFDNIDSNSRLFFSHDNTKYVASVTIDNYFKRYPRRTGMRIEHQILTCYMLKSKSKIKLTCFTKASYDHDINNFVMNRLFEKIYSIDKNMSLCYEHNVGNLCNKLSLEMINKDNYVKLISEIIPIINQFNSVIFDHILSNIKY